MDVCMCQDDKCAARHGCLRFVGPRDEMLQTYFAETPREPGATSCKYYVEASPEMIRAYRATRPRKGDLKA